MNGLKSGQNEDLDAPGVLQTVVADVGHETTEGRADVVNRPDVLLRHLEYEFAPLLRFLHIFLRTVFNDLDRHAKGPPKCWT
ncbi:hypothetical protein [Actinoplanes sp. NPDC049265]|uniref:hypothetical protein n=1 Tax=Actinoplanes sp. NPDC049265 TaxID=3363902 RepID=UPI003713B998